MLNSFLFLLFKLFISMITKLITINNAISNKRKPELLKQPKLSLNEEILNIFMQAVIIHTEII